MSALRSTAVLQTNPTNVFTPNTICYNEGEGEFDANYLPIPFTVSNGVLDIAEYDNVVEKLLTPGEMINDFGNQPSKQASMMGGLSLVRELGPNMIIFLRNFASLNEEGGEYNLVTNVAIYIAPQMTKLRFNYVANEDTYQFSNEAPVLPGPDLVSGNSSDNYRVVWIFKSPLVVSYKYDGATKYVTFTSTADSI